MAANMFRCEPCENTSSISPMGRRLGPAQRADEPTLVHQPAGPPEPALVQRRHVHRRRVARRFAHRFFR